MQLPTRLILDHINSESMPLNGTRPFMTILELGGRYRRMYRLRMDGGRGEVGAVVARKVSRFARNNREWQQP